MSVYYNLIQAIRYCKEKGLVKAAQRSCVKARQNTLQNETVMFYADLAKLKCENVKLPDTHTVEIKMKVDEISDDDMRTLFSFRDKEIVIDQLKERFTKGAVLWLPKFEHELIGFLWTIRGATLKPHYFPMTESDAVLIDVLTFPHFRGRRLMTPVVNYAICELKKYGVTRLFAHIKKWNISSLRGITRTGFHQLGLVRRITIAGWNIIIWSKSSNADARVR